MKKLGECNTNHQEIISWVSRMSQLCQPDHVFWCDGSEAEKEALTAEAVAKGVLIKLNQKKLPGCYYHRSNPNDVARVEQCTFICTETRRKPARPTTGWRPRRCTRSCAASAAGAMRGRTMYVVPYLMGPPGSPLTKVGIELTDSIYVVLSMRIMTRMGEVACEQLGDSDDFNRGLHCMLDVNPERRYIAISRRTTPSSPSAPTTAATCCWARNAWPCASAPISARQEGWMAEHMLILGVESPDGREDLRRRRLSQRLRQDQFRHADSARRISRAGRSGPSAMTSPG